MRTATYFLVQALILPAFLVAGSPTCGAGALATTGAKAAVLAFSTDAGPQGVYVDYAGHDDNDDVVGRIMYNNEERNTVHIAAIYVHGENILTQGKFQLDLDIPPGETRQMLVIMRDKRGVKAKVFVDLHFQ